LAPDKNFLTTAKFLKRHDMRAQGFKGSVLLGREAGWNGDLRQIKHTDL
tara:strand:+ start:1263 stop:1409 length:147 start_codon:yes stop_codon:yes gene_type:complete